METRWDILISCSSLRSAGCIHWFCKEPRIFCRHKDHHQSSSLKRKNPVLQNSHLPPSSTKEKRAQRSCDGTTSYPTPWGLGTDSVQHLGCQSGQCSSWRAKSPWRTLGGQVGGSLLCGCWLVLEGFWKALKMTLICRVCVCFSEGKWKTLAFFKTNFLGVGLLVDVEWFLSKNNSTQPSHYDSVERSEADIFVFKLVILHSEQRIVVKKSLWTQKFKRSKKI